MLFLLEKFALDRASALRYDHVTRGASTTKGYEPHEHLQVTS